MVADDMPVANHPRDKLGVILDLRQRAEKGGRHILFFEDIQNLFGVAVFITAVEGQIQHLFVCGFLVETHRLIPVRFKILLVAHRDGMRLPVFCNAVAVAVLFG